jgi:hypothetical protein|tara:strand:+ start:2551 stop:2868 length:318 start_codon:yes stop_codon:yes gene_type:complete
MNRHEVEKRLRVVEQKIQFILHTLALTRKNNQTGATESRTFDTLFEEAEKHGLDTTGLTDVARRAFTRPPTDHEQPPTAGASHQRTGTDGDDTAATPGPHTPDAG